VPTAAAAAADEAGDNDDSIIDAITVPKIGIG